MYVLIRRLLLSHSLIKNKDFKYWNEILTATLYKQRRRIDLETDKLETEMESLRNQLFPSGPGEDTNSQTGIKFDESMTACDNNVSNETL